MKQISFVAAFCLGWVVSEGLMWGSMRGVLSLGFPGCSSGKEPACQCRRHKRHGFNSWVGKIPQRRAREPTPVFLPGESCGQRSLAGYCPWSHKESDMTERLNKHSLSYSAGQIFTLSRYKFQQQRKMWKTLREFRITCDN